MPRSANDTMYVLLLERFGEIQRARRRSRRAQRKRNLSGGGSAKPDPNTVAGPAICSRFLAASRAASYNFVGCRPDAESRLHLHPLPAGHRAARRRATSSTRPSRSAEAARRAPEKSSVREALGRAYFRSGRFAAGRGRVRGRGRGPPGQRLRPLLPRPRAQQDRRDRARPPPPGARLQPAPRPRATTASTATCSSA